MRLRYEAVVTNEDATLLCHILHVVIATVWIFEQRF